MTVAYVSVEPNKYIELLSLRNKLHEIIDTDHYYRKKRPHITLIPSFKIESGTKRDIKNTVQSLNLKGNQLDVTGIDVFKSPEKPFVIQLSVEFEDDVNIGELRDDLEPYSKVPINVSDSLHVSLIKTRGYWDTVPQEVTDRIKNEIRHDPPIDKLTVQKTKVEFRR